jgi:hypothetical protein
MYYDQFRSGLELFIGLFISLGGHLGGGGWY